nr:hypothetical protein [Cupriavidus gilardii]
MRWPCWSRGDGKIRAVASLVLIGHGVSLFVRRRHARALARIRPSMVMAGDGMAWQAY